MAPVIDITTEALEQRQRELLASVGLKSYDEFRERARAGILSDREWGIRNSLDSVLYLLGEDELTD